MGAVLGGPVDGKRRKLYVRPPSMHRRLDRRRRLDALFLRRRSCDQPQSAQPRDDERKHLVPWAALGLGIGGIGAGGRIISVQKDGKKDEDMLTVLSHP